MKYFFGQIFLGCSVLFTQTVSAQEPDALWLKTIANMKSVETWAAQDIELSLKTTQKAVSKETKIRKTISSWDKDTPIYRNVSVTPALSDPKKASKSFGIEKIVNPAMREILSPEVYPKRSDQVMLGDKICSTFVVKQSGLPRFELKIWVQPDTGGIYQYTVDAYVPFGLDVKLKTIFKMEDGKNLPSQTATLADVLIPFSNIKVDMLENYEHWIARPVVVKN